MRQCQGCGCRMDYFGWHDTEGFCGACENRFAAMRARDEEIAAMERGERWRRLVLKYGEELAGEIWADSGM